VNPQRSAQLHPVELPVTPRYVRLVDSVVVEVASPNAAPFLGGSGGGFKVSSGEPAQAHVAPGEKYEPELDHEEGSIEASMKSAIRRPASLVDPERRRMCDTFHS
jgi:hypothetical protein